MRNDPVAILVMVLGCALGAPILMGLLGLAAPYLLATLMLLGDGLR